MTSFYQQDKEPFIMVKQSYIDFCDGNVCAAMVLSLLEFKANGLAMKNKPEIITMSHSAMVEGIFNIYQRPCVADSVALLKNKGVLVEVEQYKYKVNQSNSYMIKRENLNTFLIDRCNKSYNDRCNKNYNKDYNKDKTEESKNSVLTGSASAEQVKPTLLRRVKKPFIKPTATLFPSEEVEELFYYWNNLENGQIDGFPRLLTKCSKNPSRGSFTTSIAAISKALNKYNKTEIKQFMDNYIAILKDDGFVYKNKYNTSGVIVKLPEFFGFKKETKLAMKDWNLLKPYKSWLFLCSKGMIQLQTLLTKQLNGYAKKPEAKSAHENPLINSIALIIENDFIKAFPDHVETSSKKDFLRSAEIMLKYHEEHGHHLSDKEKRKDPIKFAYIMVEMLKKDIEMNGKSLKFSSYFLCHPEITPKKLDIHCSIIKKVFDTDYNHREESGQIFQKPQTLAEMQKELIARNTAKLLEEEAREEREKRAIIKRQQEAEAAINDLKRRMQERAKRADAEDQDKLNYED